MTARSEAPGSPASSPDVDVLLHDRAHPFGAAVAAIRAELLALPGVVESVKWKAPNYALADDFATMHLRRDNAVQLILHTGASPKPGHPPMDLDPLPRFARWADRNRAVLTCAEPALSDPERAAWRSVIARWVAQLE
jgi:hypothetical protein